MTLMRIGLCMLCVVILGYSGCRTGEAAHPDVLPTGRAISPTTLSVQNVGGLPVNMIASADGQYLISTDAGYRQSLWSINISEGKGVSHLPFVNKKGKNATTQERNNGLFYGLAAAAGSIYAAQGSADAIAVLGIDAQGQLKPQRTIKTKPGDFPAGLALDGAGRLYVANNNPLTEPPVVTPGSVAIYNATSGVELGRHEFADSFGGTPNFPLSVAVTRDGKKLYVASERDDAVYVLDTSDPANIKPLGTIATGAHPVALLFDKAQSRLYVANAHSDTVSFVDVATDKVTHTILLRPDIAKSIAGATPTGLALSPTEKFLYVSLGDMNAVAVIDVPDVEMEGYIPAGWYPSAVAVSPDGKRLFVSNAKGTQPRNPNPPDGVGKKHSPLNILEGNVVSVAVPDKPELKAQTAKVLENNRLTAKYLRPENPLKDIGLQAGKIKHVIYIIKENRTYDHVLGDLPAGNGDKNFCLFGRDITPNQHAIAERFVLLDNFYDSGEVSGDGWTWSTQAMANEYTIRNVPYEYSGHSHHFDYEGSNNEWLTGGFPAKGLDGKPLSEHPRFADGAKPFPDVAEAPGGHLWDLAKKAGLTYRNYGFFVSNGVKEKDVVVVPDNYPASAGLQPGGRDLEGLTNIDFRRFDMNYPDSEASQIYFERTGEDRFKWKTASFGRAGAPSRFSEWHREFEMMLQKDPSGAGVPNLMMIRFCTDHTAGANAGAKAPKAMVADNDFAVGQLVEAVSRSPIWKETAIFIIEDDAQDGPDHVDAHRSTCYVISPYIKKGSVDHSFHNTASCLRTMELLLGLPPMCQYDAASAPIMDWDTQPSNAEPYTAMLPPAEIIGANNPKAGEVLPVSPEARLMEESGKMDFDHADAAPAEKLNEILWKLGRGMDAKMPRTPGGIAGVTVPKVKDEDD